MASAGTRRSSAAWSRSRGGAAVSATRRFARLLLDHGADPNVRASLRKRLRFVEDESMHEYRDVTPLAWGERFHDQAWVSRPAMALIADTLPV